MGLTYSSVIDAPLGEVFAWHARRGAIVRLMPPWSPVRVEREAGSVRDGQAVLRLPAGLRWVATHQPGDYDPPHEFADALTSLPLAAVLPWRHHHHFAPAGTRATRVTDVVDTPLPAQVLRPMFTYRHRQLADDLAAHARSRVACPEPLTIAVTGSSGLVGTALTALLSTGGHRVIRLVRRLPRHSGERYWRPEDPNRRTAERGGRGDPPGRRVDRRTVLSGPQAGDLRQPDCPHPPPGRARRGHRHGRSPGVRAFVTASAIGIYGPDRGDELLTETSARGDGFLADVVADWEDAAGPAARAGIRTVQVRTGIVQDPAGRRAAPAAPAVRGRPRRPAGRRPAVAGLDRPGRPAGHLPAGRHRPGPVRAGQRGRPRAGAQRRLHAPRWPACCAGPPCCRYRRSVRGCCSVPRAPARSPRPASMSTRSG